MYGHREGPHPQPREREKCPRAMFKKKWRHPWSWQTGSSSRPLDYSSRLSCSRTPLVLNTHENDEWGLLLFPSRRIHVRCDRVRIFFSLRVSTTNKFFIVLLRRCPICCDRFWGTDRDEALILPQSQKSNRAGVKSYGLAPNQYDLYDDDVLIKNIVLFDSKIMHLPLCLILLFKTRSKNETYGFKRLICEIYNKCHQ